MPLTSFYTALTGLNNNSYAINVIGDNLANMNTTAFKSAQATFSELLAGVSGVDASGNPTSTGLGSSVNGVARNFTQGTITSTGESLDVAVNGKGYLIVEIEGSLGFTRSGALSVDKVGNLISTDGLSLMGYMGVDGAIDTTGDIVPIFINQAQLIPASQTTEVGMTANLNAKALTGDTFSAAVQVIDTLGTEHPLAITFTKTDAGWDWAATIPAVDVGGAATDPAVEVGTGSLEFDTNGLLITPPDNPLLSITGYTNGAADMEVSLILWDPNDRPMITSYANDSAVSNTNQNGFGASAIASLSVDVDGVITGTTENGRTIALAQLALENFPNEAGLLKYKGSTFVSFSSSGEPSIGAAGTGGRGTFVGSALEQSNVDMAAEFVSLIKAQRAYQANSRIITTSDELYQDSISLKR
jgi:flagellar hook protein FlgE